MTLLCGVFFSFSVDNGHTASVPAIAEYSAIEPLRFEISLHRGNLLLDGHTVSSRHEQELLHAADQSFSDLKISTRFTPLGIAPDQWANTTVSLLEALATTQSSRALLTVDALSIRGVAPEDWHEQIRVLRARLPESVELDVDILVPDTKNRAADLCARAIATHKQGPVNFEESGTALRSSAYLSLDRIVALADACRKTTVSITGHTDSSGHEAWNQQLSLARANAVADYVAQRGIARERLIVAGAGSSLPVADNSTRYGRSLNRRINIFLHDDRMAEGS
ncbi:MAG: OmpA family protein [Gammaproteobacteria bacterium]|nr:OmpA family protein [Gammaproteobacteria bacterium]